MQGPRFLVARSAFVRARQAGLESTDRRLDIAKVRKGKPANPL
ncbi:MAG TPA: hypothetical protein VGD55_09155 [Acidothermaceae bacterium]